VLTVLVLLTVPLGAPLAGDLDGVAVAAGLALLGLGLALAVLWVVTRRAQPATGIALGLVTVLALPAAALAWPAAPPLVHRAQVVAGPSSTSPSPRSHPAATNCTSTRGTPPASRST
jgi:hypothetical protein